MAEILAEQSGPRERVLDEHMYEVKDQLSRGTFRLQLFTADGLRPVAVATQDETEGWSLTNGCETFASIAWGAHVPDGPPPIWVQRSIYSAPFAEGLDDWKLVILDVESESDHMLGYPDWQHITQEELDQLVGRAVDPERGERFVPPPPEPEYQLSFVQARVDLMPKGRPFRVECMARTSWWRRLLRRWRPLVNQSCCWYHGGDWRVANEMAIRLLAVARAAGVDPEDIGVHVVRAAQAEGVDTWTLQAIDSLFIDPIFVGDGTATMFTNGQHRVMAMRDAGVAMTLIGRDERDITA